METNKRLKKAGDNLNDREIMKEVDKAISAAMDKQIFRCLGAERRESKDLDCDIITNLKEMIARNTTVILCHPNTKKQIEEYDLPPMTKIIPDSYLKENMVYIITDEKFKKSLLESEIPVHIEQEN